MKTLLFAFLLAAVGTPTWTHDVEPIFAKHCYGCHAKGVDMGGLELDTWERVIKGGSTGSNVTPGDSNSSMLYLMVAGIHQPAMPLGGAALAAVEIATIKEWIDGGAKGPASLRPQIFSLAWQPGGKLLALGGFRQVRLVDGHSGEPVASLDGHAETVRAVAFSRDGKLLATAGGFPGRKGEVKIWDVEKRTVLHTIQGHSDCIFAVAFSPDGKTIATSSYDKLIKLWDVETGKEVRTLKDHIDAVYALAFTPDGSRLISGGADRTVKIWNPATGERLYTLGDPTDGINTISIHPSGAMVAAGGIDKSIRIWRLEEKGGVLLNSLMAHEDAILKLAWSPDGETLISSGADRTIKVFRSKDLSEVKTLPQPDWAYGLEFSPDGAWFAAGRYDGSLSLYDSKQFKDAFAR